MTAAKNVVRNLGSVQVRMTSGVVLPADKDAWLVDQAKQYKITTALAHCDDGVNWGVFEGGAWRWSHEAFPAVSPPFRWETLQQLRCFGKLAELFIWRTADGFAGRVIEDVDAGAEGNAGINDCFDEDVLLWKEDRGTTEQAGFARLGMGGRGMCHAPPKAIADRGYVTFRHYLKDDDAGCARVVASRLVVK